MKIAPKITVTEEGIPGYSGRSLVFGSLSFEVDGILPQLAATELVGQSFDATLTVEVSGDDLTESLSTQSTLPFVQTFLAPLKEKQALPAFIASGLKAVNPNGFTLACSVEVVTV